VVQAPETVAAALAGGVATLEAGGFAVDYLELRDPASLSPMPRFTSSARLLVAARLGRTRLIDNIAVEPA
jgi:pantoate--beta-alanine ligase